MKWLVPITLKGKRDYKSKVMASFWRKFGISLELGRGSAETFLGWELCIPPWEVANAVFLLTEWELFSLFFVDYVLISLL